MSKGKPMLSSCKLKCSIHKNNYFKRSILQEVFCIALQRRLREFEALLFYWKHRLWVSDSKTQDFLIFYLEYICSNTWERIKHGFCSILNTVNILRFYIVGVIMPSIYRGDNTWTTYFRAKIKTACRGKSKKVSKVLELEKLMVLVTDVFDLNSMYR